MTRQTASRDRRCCLSARASIMSCDSRRKRAAKHDVQAERGREEARARAPEDDREGADQRTDRDAEVGRGREPPESLAPDARASMRVGDVRLNHADGAAARALDESRDEEQPERVGEGEDDVRDRRRREPDEQRRPSAVAIGEPPPHRRAEQLRDGEGRDQQADDESVRAEASRRRTAAVGAP